MKRYKTLRKNYFSGNMKGSQEIDMWQKYQINTLTEKSLKPYEPFEKIVEETIGNININADENPTVLYRDDKVLVFIPSIEQKICTPYDILTESPHIGGIKCRMALNHVLVIPLDRIYNAVTLDRPDSITLLKHMKNVGKMVATELQTSDSVPKNWEKFIDEKDPCIDDLFFPLKRIPSTPKSFKNKARKYLPGGLCLEKPLPVDRFEFHLVGDNSIGWLHLHVFSNSLKTKTGSDADKIRKNFPIDVVIKCLEEDD